MSPFQTAVTIIGAFLATGVIASCLAGSIVPLVVFMAASWTTWAVAKGLSNKQ